MNRTRQPESPAAELEGVGKRFGRLEAVREMDLTIPRGRILGLLGHNAAGKTTVMKMLLGILAPTTGRVRLLGGEPRGAEGARIRRRVGYLPENVAFYDQLTGAEVLAFYADLKGVDRHQCGAMLEEMGLAHAADRKVRTYSKGMRQRLGLAQALLGEPDLLMLDEPTVGLDPQATEELYARLGALRAGGTTVILSSHILAEIEDRADTLAILGRGQLLAQGGLRELRRRTGLRLRIRVHGEGLGGLKAALAAMEGVTAEPDGTGLTVTCGEKRKLAVLREVTAAGERVQDVDMAPPSLPDIYSHFGLAGEGAR
ncbi:MAG: ABC transporter ATP-binding protein [Thiohalorhabdus sp.]|uniref:ABC transporter ATP-binding protein n=1 Tax=Thiohalorhabdus sp. TaxID=3094134 RepID=UPI003980892A